MMHSLLVFGASMWGALCFRVRGGLWTQHNPLGTTGTRVVVWGGGMAALAAALGYGWLSLAMIPAMWLGAVFGWDHSIDLGHNEGSFRGDMLTMAWRGPLWTVFGALVIAAPALVGMAACTALGGGFVGLFCAAAGLAAHPLGGALGLLLAGLLCGPVYYAAWQGPRFVTPGLSRGPELGEALFGALIGGMFAAFS